MGNAGLLEAIFPSAFQMHQRSRWPQRIRKSWRMRLWASSARPPGIQCRRFNGEREASASRQPARDTRCMPCHRDPSYALNRLSHQRTTQSLNVWLTTALEKPEPPLDWKSIQGNTVSSTFFFAYIGRLVLSMFEVLINKSTELLWRKVPPWNAWKIYYRRVNII